MNLRHISELTATALAAGTLGWFSAGFGGSTEEVAAKTVATAAKPALNVVPQRAVAESPLVLVSHDGNVTLRVEQQPLEWVLDELARQTGWGELKDRGRAMKAAATASDAAPRVLPTPACEAPRQNPQQAEALLATIERGAEGDRWQALITARSEGAAVSPTTLRTLYETDGSDRVRLEAFESYLEAVSHDAAKTRAVLEQAALLPSPSIQREARLRLQQFADSGRSGASQGGSP